MESELAEVIAPWLVDPQSSKFYKVWSVLIEIMLQIEIIIVPLTLLDQAIMKKCDLLFWALDIIWVANMVIKLQTIRPEHPSQNPLKVAASYIRSEFLIDLVATLPNILTNHN